MIKVFIRNKSDLRFLIAKTGCSIRGFSNKINVSHSYLSQVINGARNPSPAVAKKIADGLGQGIEDIFFIKDGCNANKEIYENNLPGRGV